MLTAAGEYHGAFCEKDTMDRIDFMLASLLVGRKRFSGHVKLLGQGSLLNGKTS
jgi:hypothetical protein